MLLSAWSHSARLPSPAVSGRQTEASHPAAQPSAAGTLSTKHRGTFFSCSLPTASLSICKGKICSLGHYILNPLSKFQVCFFPQILVPQFFLDQGYKCLMNQHPTCALQQLHQHLHVYFPQDVPQDIIQQTVAFEATHLYPVIPKLPGLEMEGAPIEGTEGGSGRGHSHRTANRQCTLRLPTCLPTQEPVLMLGGLS